MSDVLQINSPTWGAPDTDAADRIQAALGIGVADGIGSISVSGLRR